MYRYKYHRDSKYVYNSYYQYFTEDNLTYLSFDYFLTFYQADKSHWRIIDNTIDEYLIPIYYYCQNEHGIDRYIKFSTAKDYRKFKRWYKRHITCKENDQNYQEISELAQIIGKQAAKENEKAKKELQKALTENEKIIQSLTAGQYNMNYHTNEWCQEKIQKHYCDAIDALFDEVTYEIMKISVERELNKK